MPNTNNGPPALPTNHIPSGFHAAQPQVNGVISTTGQPQYPPRTPIWQQQQYQGYPIGNSNYIFNGGHIYLPHTSLPPPSNYSQHTQQYYSHQYPPTSTHTQQQQNILQPFNAQIASPPMPLPPPPPPPPRKEQFRCQPCNIVLDSAQAFQAHTSTHIKCEKCSFSAVPKVVKGHFSAVHGQYSGNGFKSVAITIPGSKKVQRFQICVGNHPDDIQRWIAERRKRFPRQSNVHQPKETSNTNLPNASLSNNNASVKDKPGLLGSLLDGYGSSSDEDNDGNDIAAIKSNKSGDSDAATDVSKSIPTINGCNGPLDEGNQQQPQQQQYRRRLCRFYAKNGQCRNGDKCSFSHDSEIITANHDAQVANKKQKLNPTSASTKSSTPSTKLPPPPPSLLQKLLANDIQREASLTLQLLEYLVRSNFLQETDDAVVD